MERKSNDQRRIAWKYFTFTLERDTDETKREQLKMFVQLHSTKHWKRDWNVIRESERVYGRVTEIRKICVGSEKMQQQERKRLLKPSTRHRQREFLSNWFSLSLNITKLCVCAPPMQFE